MRSCKRDAVPIRASNVYTAQPAFSAVYATCSTALLPTSLEPLATLRPSSPTTRTSISSKGRPLVVTSASCSSTAGDGLVIRVDGCQASSAVQLNRVSGSAHISSKQHTLLPVLPFPLPHLPSEPPTRHALRRAGGQNAHADLAAALGHAVGQEELAAKERDGAHHD